MFCEVRPIKTVIFFDVDNTIYANHANAVLPGTARLLRRLNDHPDVILGLATGRGPNNLGVITDVLDLFDYQVLFNGALVRKGHRVIHRKTILKEDVEEVLAFVTSQNLSLGMVGEDGDAINRHDHLVEEGMKVLRGRTPSVNPRFHHDHDIFALWVFSGDEKTHAGLAGRFPSFSVFPWHKAGADLTYRANDKSEGIRRVLEELGEVRLICVGDGANDIRMITMADVGVAMGNSRFSELKEKADHVAPHIADDRLTSVFEHLGLIVPEDGPGRP
jgi:peptidyl-prolyl cis-trans isomerase B (cyclophilin B)